MAHLFFQAFDAGGTLVVDGPLGPWVERDGEFANKYDLLFHFMRSGRHPLMGQITDAAGSVLYKDKLNVADFSDFCPRDTLYFRAGKLVVDSLSQRQADHFRSLDGPDGNPA